jgi:hypothetical protein
MNKMGSALVPLLAAVLLLPQPASAQNTPQTRLLPESRVWVEGTSNRENWTVNATAVDGFVAFESAAQNALRLRGGRFSVPSAMEGGRGPIMDRLMHGTLKSTEHPNIVYELISAEATPAGNGKFRVATRGRVTLAGVTKEIEGAAEAERVAGGNLRFIGSYPLQMSDYGLTAPTAMFGALRTGDRVVVHYDLLVKQP